MKLALGTGLGAVLLLLPETTMAWYRQHRSSRRTEFTNTTLCSFTLTSTGSFESPAGQLSDGQIRLNGSYPPSNFHLDGAGGMTDQNGFGCIMTEAPITQIQCDHGKSPVTGFSLDAANNLLLNGSPTFFACAATDTEYNLYLSPSFGQTKCFAITLKGSGCGAGPSCPPVSTVWQTRTVTENATATVTVTRGGCGGTTTTSKSGTTSNTGTMTSQTETTSTKTEPSTSRTTSRSSSSSPMVTILSRGAK